MYSFYFFLQGLDEQDAEKKMENLYVGQGVGADPEEEGDDDEDEVDGNVSWGFWLDSVHGRAPGKGSL